MGYITDYNGDIALSSKKIVEKLNKFIEGNNDLWEERFNIEGIYLNDKNIGVNGYGNIYEEELELFCLFIAKIDKCAFGYIRCNGEDSDDIWRIVVEDGKVILQGGFISYDENTQKEFKSKKMNRNIYEVTEDKDSLKELVLEGLDDGE